MSALISSFVLRQSHLCFNSVSDQGQCADWRTAVFSQTPDCPEAAPQASLCVCCLHVRGHSLCLCVDVSFNRERVYIYVSKFNLECVCVCISIAHLQEKKTQV